MIGKNEQKNMHLYHQAEQVILSQSYVQHKIEVSKSMSSTSYLHLKPEYFIYHLDLSYLFYLLLETKNTGASSKVHKKLNLQ